METTLPPKFVLFLFIAMLMISGCGSTSPTLPVITEEPFPLPIPSQTFRLPTQTSVAASSTPVSTETPTLIPSLTPLPTLRAEEAQQEIARLMQTNNSCSGVCFWGITPGISDFDEAVRSLKRIHNRPFVDRKDQYKDSYQYKEDKVAVSLTINGSNGRVQNLEATVIGVGLLGVTEEDWFAFRPENILKTFGVPKRVNVSMSEGPEGRLSYEMIFVYKEMVIRYSGIPVVTKPKTTLRACPLKDHNIDRLDVWMGEVDYEIKNQGVGIDRVSAMTAETVYQTLIGDPGSACFDLDYDRYLSQQ